VTSTDYQVRDGELSDLAPTVLDILGIQKPAAMTGKSIVSKA
jgi:2,3-bisphosphoglycerate-independent phosphoglycerate mutase